MANKKRKKVTNNSRRGYSSTNRNRNGRESKTESFTRDEAGNDPSWHGGSGSKSADLGSFANLTFSYQQGQPINLGTDLGGKDLTRVIPGIHAIALSGALPSSYNVKAPINMAANKMFSKIREGKSGTTVYDPNDFVLYLAAMSEMYSYINFLTRAYRTLYMWDRNTNYLPEALLEIQNIDYNDLKDHASDFRSDLNQLIAAVAAYAIPAEFDYFKYKVFAYQDYYIEGNSIKDQMYLYMPYMFMHLGTDTDGAWKLIGTPVATPINGKDKHAKWTAAELLELGWNMFASMLGNQDIITMSGDIAAYYGSNIFRLQFVNEAETLSPVFNISVLEQMKNAFCLMQPGNRYDLVPGVQDANKVFIQAGCSLSELPESGWADTDYFGNAIDSDLLAVGAAIRSHGMGNPLILTTTTSETTSDLVLDSTRMMVTKEINYTNPVPGLQQTVINYSTYLPMYCRVCELNADGSVGLFDYSNFVYVPQTDAAYFARSLNTASNLGNFRFHPRVKYCSKTTSGIIETNELFDVDNYTIVHPDELEKIHRQSVLAELNVSGIASVSR